MTEPTPEQRQRLMLLHVRNQAAVTTLVGASQTSFARAGIMSSEHGDVDGALELIEKTIARIEGAAMAVQRLHQDN